MRVYDYGDLFTEEEKMRVLVVFTFWFTVAIAVFGGYVVYTLTPCEPQLSLCAR